MFPRGFFDMTANLGDDGRSECNVGDEMAIHNINMEPAVPNHQL